MRTQGANTSKWGFLLACLCFLIFTVIVCYPFSLQPFRFFLSHRTASMHAVSMYYFSEYLHGTRSMPFSYSNIWGYPEGGFIKILALPSLAMGYILCKWFTPRTAFNLLFMTNLIISGLTFYFVGRKIGLKVLSAIIFGLFVIFSPYLESFIFRAQIENTLLWPVGFAILAIISLLTDKKKILPFIASCILPLLILFSTPYYVIFFFFFCSFLFLFLLHRFRIDWKDRSVFLFFLSLTIAIILALHFINFYRPGIEEKYNLIDLTPGNLRFGVSTSTRIDSLLDLFWSVASLSKEKPYLGFAFISGLLASLIYQVYLRKQNKEFFIFLSGAIFFLLLAIGRDSHCFNAVKIPSVAVFIDHIYPDFQKVIILYRALPFMAICAGILIALMMDKLSMKMAIFFAFVFTTLLITDNFSVKIIGESKRTNLYDEYIDMDPVVLALSQKSKVDLPVLDLPPPDFNLAKRWQEYTYFQTQHCQKLVWTQVIPTHPHGLMAYLLDFYRNAKVYLGDNEKTKMLSMRLKNAGVGLIVLHRHFVTTEEMELFSSIFDSLFLRLAESRNVIVWRCKD